MFLLNSAFIVPGAFKFYHLRVRIDAWINPWADITDKGYQIAQSLFAIAFWHGNRHGQARHGAGRVFSAICEEMGIFGGVAVVLLCMLFTYRGIKIVLGLRKRCWHWES